MRGQNFFKGGFRVSKTVSLRAVSANNLRKKFSAVSENSSAIDNMSRFKNFPDFYKSTCSIADF